MALSSLFTNAYRARTGPRVGSLGPKLKKSLSGSNSTRLTLCASLASSCSWSCLKKLRHQNLSNFSKGSVISKLAELGYKPRNPGFRVQVNNYYTTPSYISLISKLGFFCFFLMASVSEISQSCDKWGKFWWWVMGRPHRSIQLDSPRHLRMDLWVSPPHGGLTGRTVRLGHICAYYPNSA